MSFLVRAGDGIGLEDGWPSQQDLGRLVILPGGEAGILTAWWHAQDQSEWRWQVSWGEWRQWRAGRRPTSPAGGTEHGRRRRS